MNLKPEGLLPSTLILAIFLLVQFLAPLKTFAADTCGRVAIINYQKILIDTSSTKKGEGLRYHLNKDANAKEYLDEYQKVGHPRWYHAAIGTVGTVLIITGLGKSGSFSDNGFTSKRAFIIGGALLITINFLVAKTIEYNNERLLMRSIEEYNKKNLPRIYFSPFKEEDEGRHRQKGSLGFTMGLSRDF